MKIDKEILDKIVETLVEHFDYDIEGNSHYGFDVTPYLDKSIISDVIREINEILDSDSVLLIPKPTK